MNRLKQDPKKDNHFKKVAHPGYLLRNSLVSPSLEAAIMNAKYVNALPLYRQEQKFERYGLHISRSEMAHWTILCAAQTSGWLYGSTHYGAFTYKRPNKR